MPMSIDVNLPKDHTPVFADRCVVCGEDAPGSTVKISTGSIGWWTMLFWWAGSRHSVEAPACKECGLRLHRQRFGVTSMTIAILGLAAWFLIPIVNDLVPGPFRKWTFLGIALLCLSPQILYELLNPAPFSTTAFSKSVDYEFRDRVMAYQFANLNTDAEWVKVDGEDWESD